LPGHADKRQATALPGPLQWWVMRERTKQQSGDIDHTGDVESPIDL